LTLAVLLAAALPMPALADDTAEQAESTGWRRFGTPVPTPALITVPAGTWLKVRLDQTISSDRNQVGDSFTATIEEPLIANGLVVARGGQTVGGHVVELEKGSRTRGSSRLALQVDELGLVDGQQVAVRTSLAQYAAGSSKERDAATVISGAGLGAMIGAAAEGGAVGAGIGAVAGAAAGSIGVLVSKGKATTVYPEALLTFRLEQPLAISTTNSAQAFQPVSREDYAQQRAPSLRRRSDQPPPYFYSDWYWGPLYPRHLYGPRIFIYSGPRLLGRRRW
jgi:hypothetical protein